MLRSARSLLLISFFAASVVFTVGPPLGAQVPLDENARKPNPANSLTTTAPYPVDHAAPLKGTEAVADDTDDHLKLRVEFNGSHGDRVPGFLYVPKKDKSPRPAILLQYGSGGSKTSNYIVAIGRQFVTQGFVVLTIDAPLRGERRAQKSKRPLLGQLDRATFTQYCGDYCRAVDYLTSRADVDRERLGYVGISWGAISGITYVAHDPRIKAMVSICGGGGFLGLLDGRKSDDSRQALASLDPVDHVARIAPRALLLINVTKDQLVWPVFSKALHKAAGKDAKVKWFETDHYFSGIDREKLVQTEVVQFMKDNLKPTDSK